MIQDWLPSGQAYRPRYFLKCPLMAYDAGLGAFVFPPDYTLPLFQSTGGSSLYVFTAFEFSLSISNEAYVESLGGSGALPEPGVVMRLLWEGVQSGNTAQNPTIYPLRQGRKDCRVYTLNSRNNPTNCLLGLGGGLIATPTLASLASIAVGISFEVAEINDSAAVKEWLAKGFICPP